MEDSRKAKKYLLIGIAAQVGGVTGVCVASVQVSASSGAIETAWSIVRLVCLIIWIGAAVPFVSGCMFYAKSKGWHWAVGLLGIFNLAGLLVLWQIPRLPRAPDRDAAATDSRRMGE